jgi:signal transduction histidine kinase
VSGGTLRLRLTALYSGLFLLTSTVLLVVVNLLLRRLLEGRLTVLKARMPIQPPVRLTDNPQGPPVPVQVEVTDKLRYANDLRDAVFRFQWGATLATIVVLTLVSIGVGWWLSGRMLRPLHGITATARRLSLSNLHERIALDGPQDELKDLADTFDAMLERLERAVGSQRRFIANASHELRTPLAIQRAAIQIGLDDPSPERLVQVKAELLEANRRTERLIDGLLLLAQGERGLDNPEPVELDKVVIRAREETKTPGLNVSLKTRPVVVPGDPELLHRLVANLMDNAVRYNRPDGRIEVDLDAEGVLTVRNTGLELTEEQIPEMFEPFRRLHATRTGSSKGSGLGLSIVAAIAKAHDATVDARPNPEGGLDLAVRFPALAGAGRTSGHPAILRPGR